MASKTATRRGNGIKREDLDSLLQKHNMNYVFEPNFPLSDIEMNSSLDNNARLDEKISRDWVSQYAIDMEHGDRFPALILVRSGASKPAVVVDGNHRLVAAVEAELKTFGAYVIQGRPGTRAINDLTMIANTTHGRPNTTEDRLQHALHQIQINGYGVERAARENHVSVGKLRPRYDLWRAGIRAEEVNLPMGAWSEMPAGVRARLVSIGTDEGFRAAGRLAIDAGMSISQAEEMVAELAEHPRSAQKQEEIVRRLRREYADQIQLHKLGKEAQRRTGPSPRRLVTRAISSILSLQDDFITRVEIADPEERHETAEHARAGAARLTELADALEAAS